MALAIAAPAYSPFATRPRPRVPRLRAALETPQLSVVIVNFCQWKNTARLVRQLHRSAAVRTGMAAIQVTLNTDGTGEVSGLSPFVLIVPIVLLSALCLIGVMFNALQAMTQEEFDGVEATRVRHRAQVPATVIPGPRATTDQQTPVNPPFSLARSLADRNRTKIPR